MSTNISKQKRDDLIAKIGNIRTYIAAAPQDENTGALLVYLSELEKEIRAKKYGLVLEEHREGIDEVLATHTPVMTEEKDLFINNGGQLHFLIEGDNLAALQLLTKTHKDSADIIYIDPPYNTGKKDDDSGGFIYDDKFVDLTDTFIHSKWLSFMQKRLSIAKLLLKENGVIFISIGKEEFSNLKTLCDSIFGETQLLGQIVRRTKTTSFRGNYFALRQDYANIVFVWLTPGKGELENQSKKKMDKYIPAVTTKDLADIMTSGFASGDCCFINWEKLTKKGNNALKDGERTNLKEWIEKAHNDNISFVIIVDESHQNDTIKADEIIELFNTEKIIRCSATPKPYANVYHVDVPEEDVIAEGLIKKLLVINEDFPQTLIYLRLRCVLLQNGYLSNIVKTHQK